MSLSYNTYASRVPRWRIDARMRADEMRRESRKGLRLGSLYVHKPSITFIGVNDSPVQVVKPPLRETILPA